MKQEVEQHTPSLDGWHGLKWWWNGGGRIVRI